MCIVKSESLGVIETSIQIHIPYYPSSGSRWKIEVGVLTAVVFPINTFAVLRRGRWNFSNGFRGDNVGMIDLKAQTHRFCSLPLLHLGLMWNLGPSHRTNSFPQW
jgi:hypothetical protein